MFKRNHFLKTKNSNNISKKVLFKYKSIFLMAKFGKVT